MIEQATITANCNRLLIMGDFNLPEIDYEGFDVRGTPDSYPCRFFDMTQDLFLVQNVFNFTRVRNGQQPSKLDYVFTFHDNEVEDMKYLSPIGLSDHVGLLWKLNCSLAMRNSVPSSKYAHWKADYEQMNTYVSEINWRTLLDGNSVQEMWNQIKSCYNSVVHEHVPLVRTRNKKKLSFLSNETKKMINKRERLFRIYCKTKRGIDFDKYRKIRNRVNAAIRKEKLKDEERKCQVFKTNKKAFYGYVKSKQKVTSRNLRVHTANGSVTKTEAETAEELSKFFQSVYIQEDDCQIPDFHPTGLLKPSNQDKIVVNEDDVYKQLSTLNENKSPGPDNIHPAVLKKMAGVWTYPLTTLYQNSLQTGTLPSDWLLADVTPIFKKGSRSDASNYRPVSLTSIPCKMLERIIRSSLVEHIEVNNLFSKHQHGFTKNRSCLTNLLETIEEWTEAIENGYGLDILFLDYQKAFDTVPHHRLMEKLRWYGLHTSLLSWICEFISKRSMRVLVQGSCSSWNTVTSGVPQGSVLGPLLFLLYVNDIPSLIHCKSKLFADDIKLWQPIKNYGDNSQLQNDLHSLEHWSEKWLLKFNIEKCHKMSIGHNLLTAYYLTGVNGAKQIEQVPEERDLGILITEEMKWSKQCNSAAAKAMSVLGMIKRTFNTLNKDMFLTLYSTYIRPHLEYCIQVWAPYFKKDIDVLEKVQRRATKLVRCIKNLSYDQRLEYLGLYSLSRRRQRGDLIETYKILRNIEDIDYRKFFIRADTVQLRGHNYKLYKNRSLKRCRTCFFSQRVVNCWNLLPQEVVEASSLEIFKNRLDKFMDSNELGNKS